MSRLISMRDLVWGALVVGCFLVYLPPWVPTFPIMNHVDVDFGIVLNYAFNHGWQFGRDIIYTFGPFGFVYDDLFDPGTYLLKITIWVVMSCVVGLAVTTVIDRRRPIVGLPALLTLLIAFKSDLNVFFYTVPLLLFLVFFHSDTRASRWIVPLLVALCAFISLIKFTFLALSVTLVFVIEGYRILERRYLPKVLLSYVAFLLIFFHLGGQALTNIAAYLRTSLILAGGFSEAAQRFDSLSEVGAFLVVASIFIGFSALVELRLKKRREDCIVVIALALFCFFTFKAGFVRQAPNHTYFAWAALACAIVLVYLARVRRISSSRPLGLGLIGTAFALVAFSGAWGNESIWNISPTKIFVGQLPVRAASLAGFIVNGESFREREQHLTEEYQRAFAKIRMETGPLDVVDGSVDVIAWGAALALAHNLEYRPRPVFQSHLTYDKELAKRNRNHLLNNGSPRFVLFSAKSIDRRFVSQDDAPSWLATLANYDPILDNYCGYSVWRKRSRPRRVTVLDSSVVTFEAHFSQPIELPPHWDFTWASIRLERTWLGELFNFLFKSPVIELRIEMADGSHFARRIVPGLVREGFLLNPVVESGEEFAQLAKASNSASARRAREIKVLPAARTAQLKDAMGAPSWQFDRAVSWFYRNRFEVTFRRLRIDGTAEGR